MKKEFNLRQRAEIVHLAQQASKGLSSQPLIDFFAQADDERNVWKEATDFAKTLVPSDIEERFNKYCDEHEFNRNDRQFFRRLVAEAIEFDLVIAMLKHDCEEPTKKLHVAKSGRKYRSIPDDIDVEKWDAMTPAERLHYKGLIVDTVVDTKVDTVVNTVVDTRVNIPADTCIHFDEAQGRNKCCHPNRVGKCIGKCEKYEEKLQPPTGTAEAVTKAAEHQMQNNSGVKFKYYKTDGIDLATDTDAKPEIETDSE